MKQRFLLDTHCWLWWNGEPARLSLKARQVIEDAGNEVLFSVVSAWEISIKFALGRLRLPGEPVRYIPERLESNRMTVLPVHLPHALEISRLPKYHADPFDRLLIAQTRAENLVLITADRKLGRYDVSLLPAGD
jgi:PIN domain nuclease of toxin-antitoxin system